MKKITILTLEDILTLSDEEYEWFLKDMKHIRKDYHEILKENSDVKNIWITHRKLVYNEWQIPWNWDFEFGFWIDKKRNSKLNIKRLIDEFWEEVEEVD